MAAATADAGLDDNQTLFRRLFLACFHKRKSSSPSSKHQSSAKSSLASTETDSGDSTLAAANQQRHTSSPQPPQSKPPKPTPKEPPNAAPPPTTSTKISSLIMPKARARSSAKAASGSAASHPYAKPEKAPSKAKSKSKSKYLSSPDARNGGKSGNKQEHIQTLNDIFTTLITQEDKATDSDGNTIGAESVAGYIASLGADPNTYESLLVHEMLQAEELWRITRSEFVNGWQRVFETRPDVTPDLTAQKRYIKMASDRAGKDNEYFKRLYQYAFTAGTEAVDGKRQKSMAMGTALGCWEALFDAKVGHAWKTRTVNWLEIWQQFLTDKFLDKEKGTFTRTVSKDLWQQTLAFANKTIEDETESLAFWNEDQAWPGIIDDFAVWCKEQGKVKVVEKKKGDEGMEVDD
ncbi:Cullin binding-domain-containing protein [Podospora fimiseda]|uniref:Defective in cullin neddylation protein n=1 Tax=Podospora fimiseda TaxID=252190 RepID=A0AAN7BII3_9PEZI|nr:Cullin binding-domain-containing protein [Podospora fimiseda]